jgi:hypothetical protein
VSERKISRVRASDLARFEAAAHFEAGAKPIDPRVAALASGHMRPIPSHRVQWLFKRNLIAFDGRRTRITPAGRTELERYLGATIAPAFEGVQP